VLPSGDVISCIAALTDNQDFNKFLTYRFPGNRYGQDAELAGHKMGNLMMVAAQEVTGDFIDAIEFLKKLFQVKAEIYPATNHAVTLSAETIDGRQIHTEEAIDLGKYAEPRVLNKVYLQPQNLIATKQVLRALDEADGVVVGPGDLYTNLLPVLLVPDIAKKLAELKCPKIFVVNVANKPFETKGYVVSDFIAAVKRHLNAFPFDIVLTNNNLHEEIPTKFHYDYVKVDEKLKKEPQAFTLVEKDLVNTDFPLYHNSDKLAKEIINHL
ncbi:MAG TPA: gluconeogenesis factor YvcK family protein, partial [Patescibacteria group bacterium]